MQPLSDRERVWIYSAVAFGLGMFFGIIGSAWL